MRAFVRYDVLTAVTKKSLLRLMQCTQQMFTTGLPKRRRTSNRLHGVKFHKKKSSGIFVHTSKYRLLLKIIPDGGRNNGAIKSLNVLKFIEKIVKANTGGPSVSSLSSCFIIEATG
jgi:hypothetical protein